MSGIGQERVIICSIFSIIICLYLVKCLLVIAPWYSKTIFWVVRCTTISHSLTLLYIALSVLLWIYNFWLITHLISLSFSARTEFLQFGVQHLRRERLLVIQGKSNTQFNSTVERDATECIVDLIWFDLLCLTPLSAIFQLYYGDQF